MPTPERHQLTLSQLAEFDDLLTDSLVDRVSLPIRIVHLRRRALAHWEWVVLETDRLLCGRVCLSRCITGLRFGR